MPGTPFRSHRKAHIGLTHPPPGHSYVHGQRVVFPARRHAQNVILLDFNVHPKRLASARRVHRDSGAEKECFKLVQEPNVIRNDPVDEELLGWLALVKAHPFVEDVETRLPYVTASALLGPKDGRPQHYMIDDERLMHLIVRVAWSGRTMLR